MRFGNAASSLPSILPNKAMCCKWFFLCTAKSCYLTLTAKWQARTKDRGSTGLHVPSNCMNL